MTKPNCTTFALNSITHRVLNPVSLAFALTLTLAGCSNSPASLENEGARLQNNGSLAPLASSRAQVTGMLMLRYAPETISYDDPKCFQPPQGDAETYIADCGFYLGCTASVVKLDGVNVPFVLSAAHCDVSEYLKEGDSNPLVKGRSALYLHLPSSKAWIELEGWTGHPDYDPEGDNFKVASTDVMADIAVARIVPRDLPKVGKTATIETNVPRVVPPSSVATQLENDIESSLANDALTSFQTTFDRAVFDNFPSADLYGFGLLNSFLGSRMGLADYSNREDCEEFNSLWTGSFCVYSEEFPKRTQNTGMGADLRYVNMRLIYSNLSRGTAVFLAPSSYPKGGTCQGDSGGPAFLGNDGVRVFAVESYGPFPCAGSPTVRTIVATHLNWIRSVLR